jgi:aryl-alcohol dehydrogenase-like predicted oxidoreductase
MTERKGISPAQLALAWLIHQDTTPIPGSRHASNMEQNVRAAEVTLSTDDLDYLNAILPPGAAVGDRADPAYLANLDR